jgi:hypothetical protein
MLELDADVYGAVIWISSQFSGHIKLVVKCKD